jgi:membrane protein
VSSRPGRGLRAELRAIAGRLERRSWRSTARALARDASEHEVAVHASAISFRIVLAALPFALFLVALLGFLDLDEVWRESLAPEVRDRTSEAAFAVVETTVTNVLERKEGLWLTVGAALALWEVSAAIRIAMRALDRVYEEPRTRSALARGAVSLALSVPVAACLAGGLAAAQLVPLAVDRGGAGIGEQLAGRLAGFGLAVALLATAVALLLRFGPSSPQPLRFAGGSSIVVVLAWMLASGVFALYATHVASYGSLFANLAFAFVLLTYVYVSSLAFLLGIHLEAFLRRELGSSAPDDDGREADTRPGLDRPGYASADSSRQ